jgi:uncharacterized protein (DUF885 family)
MKDIIIILLPFVTLATLLLLFKNKIAGWLHYLRGKLHVQSLRTAIVDADKDKATTGRKNMVVYNLANNEFEPAQKRLLKFMSNKNKADGNTGRVKVRKKNGRVVKVVKKKAKPINRTLTPERIHHIEKKSLYVTN